MINRSLRAAAMLSAAARRLPGIPSLLGKCAGHTRSSAYCYSVWMRHLSLLATHSEMGVPHAVAELGPGPSLGTVLAALLSGVEQAFAFDVSAHAQAKARNLRILDELVNLFEQRAPIDVGGQVGNIRPSTADYRFPSWLLDEAHLSRALSQSRLQTIRDDLDANSNRVSYVAPWYDDTLVKPESLDLIFSQAVLEHVTGLPEVYRTCHKWLRPGGLMSHQIDFRCHGTARHWNGHYSYSDRVWGFLTKARPYLINREPYSVHRRLLQENGFELLHEECYHEPSVLSIEDLAPRFRDLDEDDLTTSGVYLLARRIR